MTEYNLQAPDGTLDLKLNGKTFLRATEDPDGGLKITLTANSLSYFDDAERELAFLWRGLQLFVAPDRYLHTSGSPGDIVLPNNSAYRMTAPNGLVAEPLIKMTNEGAGVPQFGKFRTVLENGVGLRIDRPIGLLVVVDQTRGYVATYLSQGSAGGIALLSATHPVFSDKADGAEISVFFHAPENQYQIANKSGRTLGISWACLGGL